MHLTAPRPFRLQLEWLESQAFRWTEHDDGWCYGFVQGSLIKVRPSGGGMEFQSETSEESLAPHVRDYFRLDQDVKPIYHSLRDLGDPMPALVETYRGLRVLRQDPWECLVAYICSANASVERIKDNVDTLARLYGEPRTLGDVTYHAFASPERLVEAGEAELEGLGFGLDKGKRLYAAARAVTDGRLNLDDLSSASYVAARAELRELPGVGSKVADCVCLFALDKPVSFPIDRHIRNGLQNHYHDQVGTGATSARLSRWARDYFGEHAGYAGQLLFLDQRERSGR